jgi:hypothetical protein
MWTLTVVFLRNEMKLKLKSPFLSRVRPSPSPKENLKSFSRNSKL